MKSFGEVIRRLWVRSERWRGVGLCLALLLTLERGAKVDFDFGIARAQAAPVIKAPAPEIPAGPERFRCGLYTGFGTLEMPSPATLKHEPKAQAEFVFYSGTTRQYRVPVLRIRSTLQKEYLGKPIEAQLEFSRGGRGSNAVISRVIQAKHALEKKSRMQPPTALATRECKK